MEHYKPSDRKPPIGAAIECSYDNGETFEDSTDYREERHCMMAGIAGGHGYFGEGFATSGNSQTEQGLICDDPDFWRFISDEEENKYKQKIN